MPTPKLLAFSGSLRKDSWNHAIVSIAANAARAAGAEVTLVRLSDYPMPVFNEDDEKAGGLPEGVVRWKQLLVAHHGLLIGSPEYNSGYTAALKNAIDWASRAAPGEKPLAAFAGKTAGVVAASPGPGGGIRALPMVRLLLSNIGVVVVPESAAVGSVHTVLDAEGKLTDARLRGMVESVGTSVAKLAAARLAAG